MSTGRGRPGRPARRGCPAAAACGRRRRSRRGLVAAHGVDRDRQHRTRSGSTSGVDVDGDAVLVPPAGRAHGVRLLGVAAPRAHAARGAPASRRRRDGCGSSTSTSSSWERPSVSSPRWKRLSQASGREPTSRRSARSGDGTVRGSAPRALAAGRARPSGRRATRCRSRTRPVVEVGAARRAQAGAVGPAQRGVGDAEQDVLADHRGQVELAVLDRERVGIDRRRPCIGVALVDVDDQRSRRAAQAAPARVVPTATVSVPATTMSSSVDSSVRSTATSPVEARVVDVQIVERDGGRSTWRARCRAGAAARRR